MLSFVPPALPTPAAKSEEALFWTRDAASALLSSTAVAIVADDAGDEFFDAQEISEKTCFCFGIIEPAPRAAEPPNQPITQLSILFTGQKESEKKLDDDQIKSLCEMLLRMEDDVETRAEEVRALMKMDKSLRDPIKMVCACEEALFVLQGALPQYNEYKTQLRGLVKHEVKQLENKNLFETTLRKVHEVMLAKQKDGKGEEVKNFEMKLRGEDPEAYTLYKQYSPAALASAPASLSHKDAESTYDPVALRMVKENFQSLQTEITTSINQALTLTTSDEFLSYCKEELFPTLNSLLSLCKDYETSLPIFIEDQRTRLRHVPLNEIFYRLHNITSSRLATGLAKDTEYFEKSLAKNFTAAYALYSKREPTRVTPPARPAPFHTDLLYDPDDATDEKHMPASGASSTASMLIKSGNFPPPAAKTLGAEPTEALIQEIKSLSHDLTNKACALVPLQEALEKNPGDTAETRDQKYRTVRSAYEEILANLNSTLQLCQDHKTQWPDLEEQEAELHALKEAIEENLRDITNRATAPPSTAVTTTVLPAPQT
jgi:hypothetical protein